MPVDCPTCGRTYDDQTKERITTPIVGTTSVEHLEAAVEALDISLSDSDIEYLEKPYEPVPISGHGE